MATFHTYSRSWLAGTIAANVFGARRLYSKLTPGSPSPRRPSGPPAASTAGATGSSPTASTSQPPGRRREHTNGRLELLFLGRAEERKGLPMLLRAFEALRGAGVAARLTVAGATREEVAPLLLDAEGVEVVGRVTDDEKWRLLGAADVLCAPSLGGESFGMVLTEAFAAGTPVVASKIAGYRDVVRDRQDGLLVPVGDAVELGESLRDLALDPERRARMSRSARERAERFAWPQVTSEVTEVYEEALAQPRPEGRAARLAVRDRGQARRARPAGCARGACPRSSPATRAGGAPVRHAA